MNFKILILSFLMLLSFGGNGQNMAKYAVTWDRQSTSSFDNMPLSGSRGAGANVWMQDGSLWIYLAHNGAYDEQEKLLKLGAIKIRPLGVGLEKIGSFQQTLDLQQSQINISFVSADGIKISLQVRYAGEHLTVSAQTGKALSFEVAYGNWRSGTNEEFKIVNNGLSYIHRNLNSNYTLKQANFQNIPESVLNNVTKDRCFGAFITARGGLKFKGPSLAKWQKWTGNEFVGKTKTDTRQAIIVATSAGKNFNPIVLQKKAIALCLSENLNKAYALENKRWRTFWNRSFININEGSGKDDEGFQIGHNYQLFRYMLACNEGGELPLKFNGGIFTVDAYGDQQYPNNNTGAGVIEDTDPDFRRWGNLFMAQNQRWLGWPAVATGDTSLMNVSRKFYREHYATAKQRAKNLGAEGACYLESISLAGLSSDVLPTPQSTTGAAHLKYHFVMGLENAWQALCIHLSTNTNIDKDIRWMVDVVRFYDSFYQNQNKKNTGTTLNGQNRLVLYPCSGLELTGDGTNPVETVAALYAVVDGLLNLEGLTNADKTYLTQVKMRLPELPETTKNGKRILALADKWGALYNGWELPELYTAWPYRLIGVTRPGTVQIGIDTWNSIEPRGDGNKAKNLAKMDMSWMPTWVDMAALGLTQEAKQRAIAKLSYQAKASPGLRFTAYFGPGHDWMPDHNWGGSAMVGLQEMLLAAEQKANGKIYLFPAWPTDWNVDFKLYAPGNTVIDCSLKDGALVKMNVMPASRRKNIILPEGLLKKYIF